MTFREFKSIKYDFQKFKSIKTMKLQDSYITQNCAIKNRNGSTLPVHMDIL